MEPPSFWTYCSKRRGFYGKTISGGNGRDRVPDDTRLSHEQVYHSFSIQSVISCDRRMAQKFGPHMVQ